MASRTAKKKEALKRMKTLRIFPETRKQFDFENTLSMSEPPFGAYYWVEGEDLEHVREFEHKHNALVYTVIRSYTEFGKLDSYLYVSDDENEWPEDNGLLKQGESYAYVYNNDAPELSEIGMIGFSLGPAAGLMRNW